MDWDDLRIFLAVYRAGSTAGAARALKVQHTTVGRRLTGLEETLGTSLFTRTATGLIPTDAATAILAMAEDAERSMLAIPRSVSGSDAKLEGLVRLTTSEAFSGYMVRRLAKLHVEHPKLIVEVLSGNRPFDLTHGEADVAVRIGPNPDLDLHCRCIGRAAWGLYASESYLAQHGAPSRESFVGHEIIGYDSSMANTPGGIWLNNNAVGATVPMRANSINSALNAAIVGLGIAAVPCFLAVEEPTLRRIPIDVGIEREIWLVFHPDVGRVARVRRVIDFVAAEIAADRALLMGEVPAGISAH